MFQLVKRRQAQDKFQLKMPGPCVLITVTAMLKLLVSLHARHVILRCGTDFKSDDPVGSGGIFTT
jgi:hypothetical protein